MSTTTREVTFPFTFERADGVDGDGLTLEGYAAVFDSPTHIEDYDGEYFEVVKRGAFTRTLGARKPVLMFNHGRHPLLGPMPIGAFDELREDARGLYMRARLFDNWLVWPLRDAIAAQAVSGASFRFEVKRDAWKRDGGTRTRELHEVSVPELGPVVFPAYEDAKLIVRSIDAYLDNGLWTPEYTSTSTNATTSERQAEGEVDPDEDPTALAAAIDEVLDAVAEALAAGDVAEATALVTAALATSDSLLSALGAPEAEDEPSTPTAADVMGGRSTVSNAEWPFGKRPHVDRAKYNAEQLRKMEGNGQAMPGGRYPIGDLQDLSNAIRAVGRGGGSHNAIRVHIMKRARALGASKQIPDNWNADGSLRDAEPTAPRDTSTEPAEHGTSVGPVGTDDVDPGDHSTPSTFTTRQRRARALQLAHRGITRKD